MNQMKLLLSLLFITTVTMLPAAEVSIYNPAPFDRNGEVVEIPGSNILKDFGYGFVVYDANGNAVPHQVTHEGNILIETNIPANSAVAYSIDKGTPLPVDTICIGQIRYDLQDDFTWENDCGGYRLYGPSYRNGGGNVAGYDVWTKSVDYPVLAQRYVDHCQYGISYHKDHGNGMDCYTVGRTLGAGMDALVPNGEIAYPCAYDHCEILDNGPLRTTAKLICYAENIGDDNNVVEERIISLDKGSWLNKTSVIFNGLSRKTPLVTGIVVHKQNPNGIIIDSERRFIAYADLTDNPDNGNGVIYIGIVNASVPESCTYVPYAEPLGDALGQILNTVKVSPGDAYTYYWGSGWSKGGIKGVDDWINKLTQFYDSLKYPLEVEVKD